MPPNGTADLARSAVSGPSRRPAPPARTTPRIRCRAILLSPRMLLPSGGRRCLFQAVDQLLVQLPEPFRQVPVEGLEVLGDVLGLQVPGLGVHGEQQGQVGPADVQAIEV